MHNVGKKVVTKISFEQFMTHENGELYGVVMIPIDCHGVIKSKYTCPFELGAKYSVLFSQHGIEAVGEIRENDLGLYLDITEGDNS